MSVFYRNNNLYAENADTENVSVSGVFFNVTRENGRNHGQYVILSNDKFIKCSGYVPVLRKNMPIRVVGKFTDELHEKLQVESFYFNEDKDLFIKYFSGRIFTGIGKLLAEKIYNDLLYKKKDLSLFCIDDIPEREISSILLDNGIIKNGIASVFIGELKSIITQRNILSEVLRFNGTYHDAEILFSLYKNTALTKLRDDPYQLSDADISFSLIDNAAYQNRIPFYDNKRIDLLFKSTAKLILNDGGTAVTYDELLSYIKREEKRSKYPELPDEYLACRLVGSKRFKIFDNNGICFSPSFAYRMEEKIVCEIVRLMKSSEDTGITGYTGKESLDDDQRNAIDLIKTSGIKVITGGPGSGKTTVIKELISEYKKAGGKEYFLAAPTGRAAVRISESSGLKAVTVHKLLGYRPFQKDDGEDVCDFDKEHQLPKGMFVIDEMSMVDDDLFLKFLEAVPNGSIVVLSGDPCQLPSVNFGSVLHDIIQSGVIPVQNLTHIHRQNGESSIISNYYRIKSRNPEFVVDDDFLLQEFSSSVDLSAKLMDLYDIYSSEKDPYAFQILTSVKSGDVGKDIINEMIAVNKRRRNNGDASLYYKRSSYCIGDKIMMTENNYEKGYWNGDIGIIKKISCDSIQAEFYDGLREIDQESFKDVEHAWACTVHKAQGSEYDTVVIVTDDQFENMLYNSIILTAVTRAKKRVFILSMNDSVYHAVIKEGKERKTALMTLLKNAQ